MVRRKSHKLEQQPPGYTYGDAERALLTALDIEAKHRGLLRARLKNLQRLGLPGTAPGKGARARYTRAQLKMWLLAMLMADTGIDPSIVAQAIKTQWKGLMPEIDQATDSDAQSGKSPVWVALYPRLAGGAWKEGRPGLTINMFRLAAGPDEIAQIVMGAGERDRPICLFHFSRPATRLVSALAYRP
jgi:hypothetical protein